MMKDLLAKVSSLSGCCVMPATSTPSLRSGLVLPSDVKEFYFLCGGLQLFRNDPFPLTIVPPSEFASSNATITGDELHADRSDDWYIVAKSGNDQLLSIDLNPARLGYCYDSFWDRHGIAGSCPVIAHSFEDLLLRSIEQEGRRTLFWLTPGFASLGDAYD